MLPLGLNKLFQRDPARATTAIPLRTNIKRIYRVHFPERSSLRIAGKAFSVLVGGLVAAIVRDVGVALGELQGFLLRGLQPGRHVVADLLRPILFELKRIHRVHFPERSSLGIAGKAFAASSRTRRTTSPGTFVRARR